jgi:hypothetical protein
MSRILPLRFDTREVENEEIEGVCPRYIKWTKRVKAFDFSKRKNGNHFYFIHYLFVFSSLKFIVLIYLKLKVISKYFI